MNCGRRAVASSCAPARRAARRSPRRARRRPPNAAVCVFPESRSSWCRAASMSAGLVSRSPSSSSTWSAPMTSASGSRLADASRPSPSRAPARCPRASRRPSSSGSSAARSSRSAGTTSKASPAFSSSVRRDGLAGGEDQPHAGFRAASSAMTAAAVSSIERRVTSMTGQAWRAQSFRLQAISSVTRSRST